MKKVVENSFAVTGFVGKDAEIRQFTTASVARFPLAVSRKEQNGEEYVSSFIYVEAWRVESCIRCIAVSCTWWRKSRTASIPKAMY